MARHVVVLAVLLAACAASGCASLSIDVDVYRNSQQVDARAAARAANVVLASPLLSLNPAEEKIRTDVFVTTVGNELQRTLFPFPAQGPDTKLIQRQQLNADFTLTTPGSFGAQTSAVFEREVLAPAAALRFAAQQVSRLVSTSAPNAAIATALDAMNIQVRRLARAPDTVAAEIVKRWKSPVAPGPVNGALVANAVDVAVASAVPERADIVSGIASQQTISGRLVGYPIFDPAISGLLTDDKHWAPFGRNRFKVTGGNAQFVVVREGSVIFHKKSLDFDPSSAISAGQATANLALSVAGAMATGRVLSADAVAPGEASTLTASTLVDMKATEAGKSKLDARREARKALLLRLADVMERAQSGAQLDEVKADFNRLVQNYQATIGGAP